MIEADAIERPLGGSEKLFWHNDRAGGFRIVAWIEVQPAPDVHALASAVATLRDRHAILRVRITREGVHGLHFRSGAPAVPFQVDDALDLDAALEQELATPFPEQGPLARFRWVGRASTLVVASHHAALDGRSSLRLAAEVLGLAQAPDGGGDRQLPAVESWFPASVRGLGGLRRIAGALREIAARGHPVRLPGDPGPRVFGLVRRSVDAELVRRFAPSSGGPGVFDAMCAAALLAARDDLASEGPVVMTAGCPVDLRERLAQEVGDRCGLVIASLPLTLTVGPSSTLGPLAAEVAGTRTRAIDAEHHFALSRFLAVQAWLTDWVSLGRSGAARAARFIEGTGVPTLAVSNLGRLPWTDGVRSAGAASGLGATADLTLFATTAAGRTEFVVSHAMPRLDRARAARFLDRVVQQLELGG